ncbi:MAG: DUF92 domain-containing protein [Candidatus Helarchaeota archaeon]
MELNIISIIIGIITVVGFGVFSYYTEVVDRSGLIAGLFIGLTVWIFGSWSWFIIILVFHLFAAAMTKFKYKKKEKSGLAQEKGGARGWPNVLANGLTASIFALLYGIFFLIENINYDLFLFGFIGAVAAMTADTVATEIGLLSKNDPRLIINFKKVIPGTSGGVTILGEIAALIGSALIGLVAWILAEFGIISNLLNIKFIIFLCAITGGMFGCLIDSIIGATIQGLYKCHKCNKITEKKIHGCGAETEKIQGINVIDNNMVNIIGSMSGSLFSICIYIVINLIFLGGI